MTDAGKRGVNGGGALAGEMTSSGGVMPARSNGSKAREAGNGNATKPSGIEAAQGDWQKGNGWRASPCGVTNGEMNCRAQILARQTRAHTLGAVATERRWQSGGREMSKPYH